MLNSSSFPASVADAEAGLKAGREGFPTSSVDGALRLNGPHRRPSARFPLRTFDRVGSVTTEGEGEDPLTATRVSRPVIATTISRHQAAALVVVFLFLASGACLAVAPSLMPDSYNWVRHAISETAAQGLARAWVARLGIMLSAVAILLLAANRELGWKAHSRSIHRLYAILVVGLAAFSLKPWTAGTFNEFEDVAHSVLAPVAGVAFTLGVLLVSARRAPIARRARVLDWVVILATVMLPLVMLSVPNVAGAAQRTVVAVGYLWYVVEAIQVTRIRRPQTHAVG